MKINKKRPGLTHIILKKYINLILEKLQTWRHIRSAFLMKSDESAAPPAHPPVKNATYSTLETDDKRQQMVN